MKNYTKACQSRFFCTKCGNEGIPIFRKQGKIREAGHLKKLYCMYCKEEINHAEIREIGGYTYEDFLEEFESGRFIDGKREEIKDLLECSCSSCPFNKNNKCWNSNYSINCGHRIEKGVDSNG